MFNLSYCIVPTVIASRIGGSAYRTADGRWVVDSRLLRRVQMSDGEQAQVEQVDRNEALTLIAQGGGWLDASRRDTQHTAAGSGL